MLPLSTQTHTTSTHSMSHTIAPEGEWGSASFLTLPTANSAREANTFFLLRHTMDEVAQQISRVLGTEEEDEEEMNEPMLGRSNSRNGLNSPGS